MSMKALHISDELSLPLEFITQTQAILAKRGVGKSYTASVEAEEMLKAGQQVVVIDPTGAWFGLKSSADGKHEGFPIAIFGGEHGDVPLEETAGEIIASAIVERRFSAILDLSLLRKAAVNRFMAPFLEALYRLNREAMHLIVDEADAIAPQKPFGEEARMLGAMEDVVRRGRRRGIGCTLITQRAAVLNKNVLTQCEVLCAMRLVHPKDIDAMEEWINVHGDPDKAKAMIHSLPSLPVGTAWFWSPGFGDIFKCVHIRKRETFDSSATPKAGQIAVTPKVLAPVDIEKLGQQIQATVQRAKENDPAQLKRKIAELQKQIAAHKPAAPVIEQQVVEVPVIKIGELEGLRDAALILQRANADVRSNLELLTGLIAKAQAVSGRRPAQPRIPQSAAAARPALRPVTQSIPNANGQTLGKATRSILAALAQHGDCSKNKIAILTGYAVSGGGFNNALSDSRTNGWIEGSDPLQITQAGIDALGDYAALPRGQELVNHWMGQLHKAEREVLRVLLENQNGPMSKEEVAALTESDRGGPYAPDGGGFNNAISKLRTLELIRGGHRLQLAEELAEAI